MLWKPVTEVLTMAIGEAYAGSIRRRHFLDPAPHSGSAPTFGLKILSFPIRPHRLWPQRPARRLPGCRQTSSECKYEEASKERTLTNSVRVRGNLLRISGGPFIKCNFRFYAVEIGCTRI